MERNRDAAHKTQVIVMVKGHPGSGKSLTARRLASKLRWPVVDKDDSRSPLHGSDFSKLPAAVLNQTSYQIMFRTADTLLSCGLSVILDCPFAREELYISTKQLADKVGAKLVLIECKTANESLWRNRLEERASREAFTEESHKPASWDEVQRLVKSYDGCFKWSEKCVKDLSLHVEIDTTGQESIDKIVGMIASSLHDRGLVM